MTYDFIFRLVLYSHEGVSFNIIVQNMLEGTKQLNLSFRFKKNRLETPFKCDNVKALIKTSICENWSFISFRKFRKLQHLLCFFGFSLTSRLKMFSASPND